MTPIGPLNRGHPPSITDSVLQLQEISCDNDKMVVSGCRGSVAGRRVSLPKRPPYSMTKIVVWLLGRLIHHSHLRIFFPGLSTRIDERLDQQEDERVRWSTSTAVFRLVLNSARGFYGKFCPTCQCATHKTTWIHVANKIYTWGSCSKEYYGEERWHYHGRLG